MTPARCLELALRDVATSVDGFREPALGADRVRYLCADIARRTLQGTSDEDDTLRRRAALLAAAWGRWQDVVELTGSSLPRTVKRTRTFDANDGVELVRHFAVAAKQRLGVDACTAALRHYAAHSPDPVELLVLATLAFHGAGELPRGETARRLDELLTEAPPPARLAAVSLVDDAQVSIFEKYLPVLTGDTAPLSSKLTNAEVALYSGPSQRRTAGDVYALAYLVGLEREIAAAAAQQERDRGDAQPNTSWLVLACLGLGASDWRKQLSLRLDGFGGELDAREFVRKGWATNAAAVALALERPDLVATLCGKKLAAFKRGQHFGGDARAVLRYFAAAVEAEATKADVEPAWVEFLVAHVPGTRPHELGGDLGWGGLFGLAFAYFHLLGEAPEARVGHLLRSTLRGAPP